MPSDAIVAAFRRAEKECRVLRARMEFRRLVRWGSHANGLSPAERIERKKKRDAARRNGAGRKEPRGHQSKDGMAKRGPNKRTTD